MKDVIIASAVRTAIGKAPRGSLRATRPDDLAAFAISGALERVPQLDRSEIEDVILGCAMPEAEQGLKGSHGRSGAKRISPSCRSHVPRHSNVPSGIAQCLIRSSKPPTCMASSLEIISTPLPQRTHIEREALVLEPAPVSRAMHIMSISLRYAPPKGGIGAGLMVN